MTRRWNADLRPRRKRGFSGVKIADKDQETRVGPDNESAAHPICHLQLAPRLLSTVNDRHQRQEGMKGEVMARRSEPPEAKQHIHHRLIVASVIPVGATEVAIPEHASCCGLIRRRHERVEQWAVSFRHL
ncbi:MAG: hypothetical protein KKF36_06530 [Alphaproteobacteria bacterium]|nr:hypothetical protein [Alphaproteobacteria bacterium]